MGGIGHTSCTPAHEGQPAGSRSLLRPDDENRTYPGNTPASQGGIGDLYNFKLAPS